MLRKTKLVQEVLFICLILFSSAASALPGIKSGKYLPQQEVRCEGVVKDATGELLIGASVVAKKLSVGVITDYEGRFVIKSIPLGTELEISYVGYLPEKVIFKGQFIEVTLKEDSKTLDEVVVTALGIKRQKRSLGYSTVGLGGNDLVESRDNNLGNALSGKIPGVSVSGNATGEGGSSRVIIRGNGSLTGNNQPLYIVDGVPLDNTNVGSAGKWGGMDTGDGLMNINPDDVDDIQILKGAAASALYGYRGGNGVVLITTKSGKIGQPMSIELNNNLTFNTIYDYRDFQQKYGQGENGLMPTTSDEAKSSEQACWGAVMNGQQATNFLGNKYNYDYIDNWDNFYRTGLNNTTSLSISGGSKNIAYRFGIFNLYNKGILPNSSISQQGINMNTTYNITPKLHFIVNANYVFDKSKGRSNLSDGNGNTNAALLYHVNSFDIRWLERGAPDAPWGTTADGKELLGGTNIFFNNPYWLQYRKTNEINKNRLTGGMTLKYDITDWLYIQGAVTRDGYTMEYKQIQPMGAAADPGGYMEEYSRNYSEMNLNYLLGFSKTFGDYSVDASFGGNRQRNITKRYRADGRPFLINGVWSINSTQNRPFQKDYIEYRVNSIYGTLDLGYKNQLFLNFTGRNDWFSTLSPDDNSYFYPSVGASWVFTDTFNLPDFLSFGKLRATYAAASNGTDPYQNLLFYKMNDYKINGQSNATVNNSTSPNKALKPVRISEFEVGLNLAFFQNRLSFDATYYRKKTKDDIVKVSISKGSGFESAIKNIGEIENSGFEFMLNAVPIKTRDFIWSANFNIAYNDSEVKNLGGALQLGIDGAESRFGNVSVKNIVGQSYGMIVGYKYKRSPQGAIVFENGIPQHSDELQQLGSGVHDITGGFRNDFSYKGFFASMLLDFKAGGHLFSGTNMQLFSSGLHKSTIDRGDGNKSIVGEGVMKNASGEYVKNTVSIPVQDYYKGIVSNNIAEEFVYNASFIKLRELSIGYDFTESDWFKKIKFVKGLRFSFVGRNLWTILKHTDNIDPESGYNNSNGQGLELNGYPATRSFGFNLNVKF